MRDPADNSTALATFIAKKVEFDKLLARLVALSGEHFNWSPDEVNWGNVGTLHSWLKQLRQVSDAALNEGEHAG